DIIVPFSLGLGPPFEQLLMFDSGRVIIAEIPQQEAWDRVTRECVGVVLLPDPPVVIAKLLVLLQGGAEAATAPEDPAQLSVRGQRVPTSGPQRVLLGDEHLLANLDRSLEITVLVSVPAEAIQELERDRIIGPADMSGRLVGLFGESDRSFGIVH